MKRVMTVLLLIVLLFAGLTPARAKGPMPVRIEGPGLPAGGIELTEPADYEPLAMGALPDFFSAADPVPASWTGYAVQRFWVDETTGQAQIFDDLIYYPDPAGERGVVYYVGIHNGWSEYDEHWFYASAAADARLRVVLGLPTEASRAPSCRSYRII